jgi:acetolactate synthase-1/2/3 large subunit
VIDQGDFHNFPSRHPLNLTNAANEVTHEADVILCFNIVDPQAAFSRSDFSTRRPSPIVRHDAQIIDVTLRHYGIKSWGSPTGACSPWTWSSPPTPATSSCRLPTS